MTTAGRVFTVAIDGPAAAGKGTIARAVASHFEFAHLDTGLLYRAVGRRHLAGEDPVDAARTLTPSDLRHPDLRLDSVGGAASEVAAMPEVRTALKEFQRRFARRAGGTVLDGRDIGTVICPEAEVKLFVTASEEIRARRRLEELLARGSTSDLATVLADMHARDARDAARATAPMRPAADALMLDTTDMTIPEAVAAAIAHVRAALRAGGGTGE